MKLTLCRISLVTLTLFVTAGHQVFVYCFSSSSITPRPSSVSSFSSTKGTKLLFQSSSSTNSENDNDSTNQNDELYNLEKSYSILRKNENEERKLNRRNFLGGILSTIWMLRIHPQDSYATSDFGQSSIIVSSEADICQELGEDELQRINLFNKVAPGVVYIDTFAELRNSVSTDV